MSRTRRVLGVLVASGLISTGLLGGTALAADQDLSVSPNYGANNSSSAQTLTFTTTGSSFLPGASVLLTYHGVPSRTIANSSPSQVNPTDSKKLTAPVTLTAAAPGLYDVKVTNPPLDGTVFSCTSCFTVTGGIPTTNGFGRTANSGSNPASFTLTGTNFALGTTLSFLQAGVADPKVVWTTTSATGSKVVGTLAIDPAANGGSYDVVATNTDGKKGTCTGCLQVPRISAVRRLEQPVGTHAKLGYGVQHASLLVTGVGLTPNTSFGFYSQAQNPNATKVNSKTYDAVNKTVTLDVTVSDPSSTAIASAVDEYGVIALDKGDGYGTLADALTLSPRPVLDSNAPFDKDNPGQGTTGFVVGLKGTGFQPGMTAAFNPSTGITVNHVDVHSPTSAGLDLTIAGDAPLTARNLHLTNPDLGVNSATTSMTPSAAPVITSSSPTFVGIGTTSVTITLTGSGFQTQSLGKNGTASTSNSYNDPVLFVFGHNDWTMNGSAVASNSGKNLTATLNIPADTPAGAYRIGYLDKNGSIVECFTASHGPCFTVEDLAVSSVTPSIVTNDNTQQTLTITGSNFAAGAVPVLQRAGQPDVVGTDVRDLTPTSLTADFDVDGIAPGNGAWDVRVTLPNGRTGHKANGLSVAGQVPHLTSISPSTIGAGNPAYVLTVHGTSLARGATLTFSGLASTGPTQVGSEWISDSEMRFTLNTVGASTGQRGIVLTNTDGQATQASECPALGGSCLSITAAPTVDGASPASRAAGSATVPVTISGTFGANPTVAFSGTGVTAGSPTSKSSTSIVVPVTVAPDASLGARDITVTNGDGGMDTCSGCFTVLAPPTIDTVSPAAQRIGTGPSNVTITGSGFSASGVAVDFGPGVTTGAVTVNDPTSITVPVTVSPTAAPLGARDVTVTNAAPTNGGTATAQKAFSIGDLPSVPLNLAATRGNGVVNLQWDAPTSDGGVDLSGYDVTVTKTADGTTPTPAPDVTVEGTTAQVSGLVNGTSYSFTVAAVNVVGTGPATAPVAATPASVPDAPTGVTGTPGPGSVTLTWTAPNDGGSPITSYQVFLADGTPKGTATTTSKTVTGLSSGSSYSFYVVAVNALGSSSPSDSSAAVTPQRSTTKITLGALPGRVLSGNQITLTGTLTRLDKSVAAGQVVLKVRDDNGKLWTVAGVTPDSTGKYGYRITPVHNGAYTATYAGDSRNTPAVSTARRVLVAVRITASAPTGSHTVNQVISGSVQPARVGFTVSLYSVSSTGKLTRLAVARVSSKSTYSFSIRLSAGNHLLQVGMANTPGNDHGEVRFIAKRT